MAEVEVDVQVVAHRYTCDECGEEMAFTGTMLPMSPPLYRHACPNRHQVSLSRMYPCVGNRIAELSGKVK